MEDGIFFGGNHGKPKKKSSGSKIRQFIFLLALAGAIAFLFKTFTSEDSVFKIETGSSTFGSPVKKSDKNLDEAGHTEDFWTSGRFKW